MTPSLGTFPKIHPFWRRHPSLSPSFQDRVHDSLNRLSASCFLAGLLEDSSFLQSEFWEKNWLCNVHQCKGLLRHGTLCWAAATFAHSWSSPLWVDCNLGILMKPITKPAWLLHFAHVRQPQGVRGLRHQRLLQLWLWLSSVPNAAGLLEGRPHQLLLAVPRRMQGHPGFQGADLDAGAKSSSMHYRSRLTACSAEWTATMMKQSLFKNSSKGFRMSSPTGDSS